MIEERDVGYTPAYMQMKVEVMVDYDEPMLFSALSQLASNMQFGHMSNAAKARCAYHLAAMLDSTEDDWAKARAAG